MPTQNAYSASMPWSPEQEIAFLKNQSTAMEQEIERIRSRIDELSSSQQPGAEQ